MLYKYVGYTIRSPLNRASKICNSPSLAPTSLMARRPSWKLGPPRLTKILTLFSSRLCRYSVSARTIRWEGRGMLSGETDLVGLHNYTLNYALEAMSYCTCKIVKLLIELEARKNTCTVHERSKIVNCIIIMLSEVKLIYCVQASSKEMSFPSIVQAQATCNAGGCTCTCIYTTCKQCNGRCSNTLLKYGYHCSPWTLVKLAMPPPMMRTLPSGCFSLVIRLRIVLAYSNVWPGGVKTCNCWCVSTPYCSTTKQTELY